MHMADALLSPAVGGAMWAVSSGTLLYCSKKVRTDPDHRKIPLMGVLGAFVFAAQMVNFTVPGTGSSGHLGGGMILAILLGPHAALITLASVLTVQALFFADGGLLALGCNIFNLGILPCFIAYPLLYRKPGSMAPSPRRSWGAAVVASVGALQLGAFGVVLETFFSGVSSIPFAVFLLLMQSIHLAIGIAEGLVTASVVSFIRQTRPDVMGEAEGFSPSGPRSFSRVLAGILMAAAITAGGLSWFASNRPDGLEWAIAEATQGRETALTETVPDGFWARLQEVTAIMPDYALRPQSSASASEGEGKARGSSPQAGVGGMVGGIMTLILTGGIGMALRRNIAGSRK